jgi:protease-4
MAMSRRRKIVLIISGIALALVLAVMLGVALIIAALTSSEPTIHKNSVLVLKVKGSMPDYAPEDFTRRLLGQSGSSLTNLLTQIKKAKADKRISALLLEINLSDAGWAKAEELRDAVTDFRTAGKPVYAYMEAGFNKEFYIASAADSVYVMPGGHLFIYGYAAEAIFFRGSLDKLGIYPDVFQIGKYKNAPDQYTRKDMSEGHREVVNALLDDMFNRYIEAIAKRRNKSAEEVRAIVDNAPYSAADALKMGLIDGANYRDEVENELKKRLGYKDADKLKMVSDAEYRGVEPESLGLNKGESIAVIYASGEIHSGKSNSSPFGDQSVGSDTLVKAINDARDDKQIKAIVLRVDSPGGTSYASDMIWHAIESAKQKKPVVVSMSDLAASGGYYISCNANRIIAEPSTFTGSIGIYAGKPVVKGLYDWLGISNEYILRGKNAGMFRETEPFTTEERAKFEGMIKSTYYDEFVPKVARGRGRDAEYIDSVGQGRVWTGAQGREKGLVDEFGGLERALQVAKQLANIPADKGVRPVVYPYTRGFFEELFGSDDERESSIKAQQQRAAFEALPEDVRRALRYSAMLDRMKRGEMMAIMPFEITIK